MDSGFTLRIGSCDLQLVQGDITKIAVETIVNAANSQLAGGGGVDGAIHRAGGGEIMRELDVIRERIGQCKTGSAVATSAGRLPAKYIFHAVGPRYRDGKHGEATLLRSCYSTCLDMALERGVQTISFPSISTGVYGYPVEPAAELAMGTVTEWVRSHPGSIRAVLLVQFSAKDHETYMGHARSLTGDPSEKTKQAGTA